MRRLEMSVLGGVLTAALVATAAATAAAPPTAVTGSHSDVANRGAALHGTVNPNGSATTYYFQWGLTTAYGVNSAPRSAGAGTKPVSARAAAGMLIPGTAYHYRLVATNAAGTAVGADRTFTTAGHAPPAAATGPATGVGKNAATMTAVVTPNKENTTYFFQYGTTTAYGSQTPAAVLHPGTAPVTVSAAIGGLEASTIFHYRIVAEHGSSVVTPGADGTFMTLPRHRPVPLVFARTRPGLAAGRPFVFTTRGSVRGPSWIPGVYDCHGSVTVRFLLGDRRIRSLLLPLGPGCGFSGSTAFTHLPGHGTLHPPVTLTVRVRFAGNGYLRPRRATTETVTLG
jgi:phosphodiesterase/alkaline phosphatase D-like protein